MKAKKSVNIKKAGKEAFLLNLPLGLVGFPGITQLSLEARPDEAPFIRLRDTQGLNLEFLAIKPYGIIPDYIVELSEEDQGFLKIEDADSVLILNIVTVHHNISKKVTVNLVGPIVINTQTHQAKQVVIDNYNNYSAWYVLFEHLDALPQAVRA